MEFVKEMLENAIGRAEECCLLTKHPDGLRIHMEYIEDLVQTLLKCGYKAASAVEDRNEVLAAAMNTLRNLRSRVTDDESDTKPAVSDLRTVLESILDIKLPSFDGRNEDVEDFIRRFLTIVADYGLSDVVGLIVLKSCLTGIAYDLVNVLPTSAKNFSPAISLLKRVYGDSERTIELYHSMVALLPVSSSDGTEFGRTFWELERILESMQGSDEDDHYLRSLYLKKFSLNSVLVKDPNLPLTDIRAEIRHMVYLQEWNCQNSPANPSARMSDIQNNSEKSCADTANAQNHAGKSADEPSAQNTSQKLSGGKLNSVNGESNAANDKAFKFGDIANAIHHDSQLEDEWDESSEDSDGTDNCPFITVRAPVSYHSGGKTTSTTVRMLLHVIPSASLLAESAAKRLGINVCGLSKSLTMKDTNGDSFSVTPTVFVLGLDFGNGLSDGFGVHIVDDSVSFFRQVKPARSVAEFEEEHPHLSHFNFPDTGEGRPVELLLSGEYWYRYVTNFRNYFPSPLLPNCPAVKKGWKLTPSVFGFLVSGKAKEESNGTQCRLLAFVGMMSKINKMYPNYVIRP